MSKTSGESACLLREVTEKKLNNAMALLHFTSIHKDK